MTIAKTCPNPPTAPPFVRAVVATVCGEHDITEEALRGDVKTRTLSDARKDVIYLLRSLSDTRPSTGAAAVNITEAGARNAYTSMLALLDTEEATRERIARLTSRILGTKTA